jgi:hypothetical protein
MGHGQRGEGVVAQAVDAERQLVPFAHRASQRGHVGDDVRRQRTGVKRHVAEVLKHQAVDATAGQRVGIGQQPLADRRTVASVTRRSRQRQQVQHADHRQRLVDPVGEQGSHQAGGASRPSTATSRESARPWRTSRHGA